MREIHSPAAISDHAKTLTSPDDIAHSIEMLRHVIDQVKEIHRGALPSGDEMRVGNDTSRVPSEVFHFHARREIVMTERHVRESIAEIFGKSSPEARKYQHFRLNTTTKSGIEDAVAALESLIFQLEEKRLLLVGARPPRSVQNSDIDSLTDLYARRLLDRYLVQELDRSQRYGYPCVLVFFSLRNWRAVHIRQGSSVANTILVKMACACKASLRAYDYAARVAEDEFAILLPQSDSQGACAVSRRIAEKFE
ncbi:MAG: GGDEF domain-containing protein, partial [Nitrospiraceae bacterium]